MYDVTEELQDVSKVVSMWRLSSVPIKGLRGKSRKKEQDWWGMSLP